MPHVARTLADSPCRLVPTFYSRYLPSETQSPITTGTSDIRLFRRHRLVCDSKDCGGIANGWNIGEAQSRSVCRDCLIRPPNATAPNSSDRQACARALARPLTPRLRCCRLSNRGDLRPPRTDTKRCQNAPHERCQRGKTSTMSLPCGATSLALAIGDGSSVDGDIDHGWAHLRTNCKSRRGAWLPLPRDHRRSVN